MTELASGIAFISGFFTAIFTLILAMLYFERKH